MFRVTALCVLIGSSFVHADNAPIVARTAPPQFVVINEFDAGRELLIVGVVRSVAVTKTRQVEVNGQKRVESFVDTVLETVLIQKSTHGAKFWNNEGKLMVKASALQMLKRGSVLLTTESPDGIDPLYLKALAKDAIIMHEVLASP